MTYKKLMNRNYHIEFWVKPFQQKDFYVLLESHVTATHSEANLLPNPETNATVIKRIYEFCGEVPT